NPTPPTNPAPNTPVNKEEELTTFTTTIYDKDPARVHNITLAISKINNKVIKSGEVFSFNNTVGQMGESNGYKKALGFDSKGKKIKISGGGLCQISSTIYNTALNINLEILERHPHSKRVYYVPKDKDATIVYGSLDLKFKNNTNNDIKVIGSNDDKSVTIKLIKLN
ncbi:MAG: VanW family protein, partial [Clostridia bacterium]